MSTPVGQPAHCAYVVCIGEEWPTGNDVSGPETNGASVYEGTGFPTMHRLYEPIHADKPAFLKSSRLSWVAHLFFDRRSTIVRVMPGLKYSLYPLPGGKSDDISKLKSANSGTATSFDLAAVTPPDPNNFGVVWEGELEVNGDGPLMVDLKADDGARLTVGGQTVVSNQGPVALRTRQGGHPLKLEYGQASGNLSLSANWASPAAWNSDWTGAYQQALTAQPIHYPLVLEYIKALETTPNVPASTWQTLIGSIASAYAPYHEAAWALVDRCYKNAAPAMKPEERMALLLQCHQRIKQENAPKFFGYNLGSVLTAQADSLGDVHLNPAQAKTWPKMGPPSESLLSKDGMLQTSSACEFDRPLSYRAILDGSAPGWFDTNSEKKPWAQVALAGDAEITSIIAVNRYEYAPEQEEFQWAVPFKVLLSTDGKTWTEAAT